MSACDQHRVMHDKYSRENININVTPDNFTLGIRYVLLMNARLAVPG